jgi:hypothetical protein
MCKRKTATHMGVVFLLFHLVSTFNEHHRIASMYFACQSFSYKYEVFYAGNKI